MQGKNCSLHQKGEEHMVNKQVLTAKDIAEICCISESKSYQIIRQLNEELAKAGYLTFRGKISRAYFYEKMYGMKANDV